MRKHPKRLSEAGITRERLQELQAVCRQYPAYMRHIRAVRAGIVDKPPRRSGKWRLPDPTGNAGAANADALAWECARVKLIESCAARSAPDVVAKAVLKSVTTGVSFEILRPPCGINQFYEARLWFFMLLDDALKNE